MHCLGGESIFSEAGAPGIRCDMARAEPIIGSLGQDQMQCLRGNAGGSLKDIKLGSTTLSF